MAAPLGWLPSPRLDRARLAPPAGAPQRARAGGSSQRLSPGTPAPPLLRPQPCCMLAPHFLSPSFFSSLHPSPCRQNPPLKHNDNNTPAASACRACVYALARCLPACLPLLLLLAAPPPPPVAPCRPHGQWDRHGERRGPLLPAKSAAPPGSPESRRWGQRGRRERRFTLRRQQLRGGVGNKSQPTDVVCCNCLGGEGGTCWGRKDPSPLCSVGEGRCSEKLRGCRWCPARGPWDAPARHPVPAARQVSFNCYCLAG